MKETTKLEIKQLKEKITRLENKLKFKEASNYPSQEEVEFLIEWSNNLNNMTTGRISGSPIKKAYEEADKLRIDVWDYAFGDKSPWSVKRGRKGGEIYWNDDKAEKLGLGK